MILAAAFSFRLTPLDPIVRVAHRFGVRRRGEDTIGYRRHPNGPFDFGGILPALFAAQYAFLWRLM
jgi:hypothetical protein